jgi:hypothetical protein
VETALPYVLTGIAGWPLALDDAAHDVDGAADVAQAEGCPLLATQLHEFAFELRRAERMASTAAREVVAAVRDPWAHERGR